MIKKFVDIMIWNFAMITTDGKVETQHLSAYFADNFCKNLIKVGTGYIPCLSSTKSFSLLYDVSVNPISHGV